MNEIIIGHHHEIVSDMRLSTTLDVQNSLGLPHVTQ